MQMNSVTPSNPFSFFPPALMYEKMSAAAVFLLLSFALDFISGANQLKRQVLCDERATRTPKNAHKYLASGTHPR
jgi:hypothetical protein